MSTLTRNQGGLDQAAQRAHEVSSKIRSVDIFRSIFGDYEFNRYFIISILLLWNVCLAGITVSLGAMLSPFQLVFLVFPTMALLSWILAVQPMRTILWIATIATAIDVVLIVYNLLQ